MQDERQGVGVGLGTRQPRPVDRRHAAVVAADVADAAGGELDPPRDEERQKLVRVDLAVVVGSLGRSAVFGTGDAPSSASTKMPCGAARARMGRTTARSAWVAGSSAARVSGSAASTFRRASPNVTLSNCVARRARRQTHRLTAGGDTRPGNGRCPEVPAVVHWRFRIATQETRLRYAPIQTSRQRPCC